MKPSLVELIAVDGEWQKNAACRGQDTSWWFPEKYKRSATTVAAMKICAECPVAVECLDYATSHHEWGIWAGTSEKQRRPMTRTRGAYARRDQAEHGTTGKYRSGCDCAPCKRANAHAELKRRQSGAERSKRNRLGRGAA